MMTIRFFFDHEPNIYIMHQPGVAAKSLGVSQFDPAVQFPLQILKEIGRSI